MAMTPIEAQIAHGQRPAVILDEECRVRFVNAAMEKLLGWRRDEFAEGRWPSLSSGDRAGLRQLVEAAFRGETSRGELSLVTRSGRLVSARIEVARDGQSRDAAVLVVSEVREAPSTLHPQPLMPSPSLWAGAAADCVCQVSRGPSEAGIVRSLRFLDPTRDAMPYVGRPLSALFDELGAAPALHWLRDVLDGRAATSADVILSDKSDSFCVVTARAASDTAVSVSVRCVDAKLLPELVDAKAARIADTSRLSDRERQVLTLLLHGRGVEDIAAMLKIAPRTVKFHQANVLQKVGADSRVDLLRVVL